MKERKQEIEELERMMKDPITGWQDPNSFIHSCNCPKPITDGYVSYCLRCEGQLKK